MTWYDNLLIWIFIRFSDIFSDFSDFFSNFQISISSQNRWFTSQIWNDNFRIQIFTQFSDFSQIFRLYVLTIFFHRIDVLLIKHEMIIFLSGILSGFLISFWIFLDVTDFSGFFSDFLQILISLFEIKVYSAHEIGLYYFSLVFVVSFVTYLQIFQLRSK